MSQSFTHGRRGKVYPYYASAPLQLGRSVKANREAWGSLGQSS